MSKAKTMSALGVLALVAGPVGAAEYGTPVTTEQAKKIAAGAIAECASNKWNVAVAIVDNQGGLVYYERMENTQSVSFDVAIMKARSAAVWRRPTRTWVDVIAKSGPAVTTLPAVVGSPGGLPIMAGGRVIGGVGVSGVTGDQDEQCAKAGLGG